MTPDPSKECRDSRCSCILPFVPAEDAHSHRIAYCTALCQADSFFTSPYHKTTLRRCHTDNITYSQGDRSLEWAVRDAAMRLRTGEARNVLVCAFDETLSGGRTAQFAAESRIYTLEES